VPTNRITAIMHGQRAITGDTLGRGLQGKNGLYAFDSCSTC
jgi:hypothetical protein